MGQPPPFYVHRKHECWLDDALTYLRTIGFCVIEGVVSNPLLETTKEKMYGVQKKIRADLGEERLKAAKELGVLRLMMKYDPFFADFLAIPEMLALVDSTVSPTAILHLQNGFILPPTPSEDKRVFQNSFHRDFPRYLNGYVASINVFIAIDEYSAANGATRVVPGSHQQEAAPDKQFMEESAISAECPAGSLILFDSTLWHAAGTNTTAKDRFGMNHQFTRSWIKQQIDYVRALDPSQVAALPPRSQQLLGAYTRVVTSLDDYYQPAEKRLYRAGQG